MSKSAKQTIQTDLLLGVTDVPIDRPRVRSISTAIDQQLNVRSLSIADGVEVPHSARVTTPTQSFTPLVGGFSTPDGSLTEKGMRLQELRERHDLECAHCTTVRGHIQTVFGEGNPDADLFFVGEAPGETEDRIGRPFVGRAGQKLDEMIRAMGLRREDCYIANVLKSRPPENRTPLPSEIERCGPYLVEQILIVNPKVIVTLGGPATKVLLNAETGITKLRGVWAEWIPPASSQRNRIPLMPTYHPAYLLRNYTVETRTEVWSDLKAVALRLLQLPTS